MHYSSNLHSSSVEKELLSRLVDADTGAERLHTWQAMKLGLGARSSGCSHSLLGYTAWVT